MRLIFTLLNKYGPSVGFNLKHRLFRIMQYLCYFVPSQNLVRFSSSYENLNSVTSLNIKLTNKSYENKSQEHGRKGDRQVSENATAKNVNKIHLQAIKLQEFLRE